MKRQYVTLGSTLTVALLLLTLLLLMPQASQVTAQSGITNFSTVAASRDVYVGRDLSVGGSIDFGGSFAIASQGVLTLTMNGWLTPTGTFQPIAAAGAVGLSGANIAAGEDGDLLILLNTGSQTITISETTGLVSAGNIALGGGDSATLIYHGTSWYQIGASNN